MEMETDIKADGSNQRLNHTVAITVVFLSVFMAVANIKGDNINQAMQKAKSETVDAWAEYQAARIKLHVDENALATLRLLETTSQIDKALTTKQAGEYETDIRKYQERSKETRAKADGLEAEYEKLNYRDDQFDLSQAFVAMAIALAAIATLVGFYWVLYVAWATGAIGVFMGLAGFMGMPFRSAMLASLLGA